MEGFTSRVYQAQQTGDSSSQALVVKVLREFGSMPQDAASNSNQEALVLQGLASAWTASGQPFPFPRFIGTVNGCKDTLVTTPLANFTSSSSETNTVCKVRYDLFGLFT